MMKPTTKPRIPIVKYAFLDEKSITKNVLKIDSHSIASQRQ